MESRLLYLVAFLVASAVPCLKADESPTGLNYNFTRTDCGKTKLCVENPTGCDPSGSSDCFFTSTKIVISNFSLTFELSGVSTGYIALAAGSSSNVSQGRNVVFVCGNNSGSFFFQTTRFTNNTLEATTSPNVNNIQYRLKQPSLIQCAFTVPITLNNSDALTILGINVTTLNISNFNANSTINVFVEVYQGTTNGTSLGQPKSAFGSSVSVNVANVNSSVITTTTTAPTTTAKPTSGSTSPFSLMSHASVALLAGIALRLL